MSIFGNRPVNLSSSYRAGAIPSIPMTSGSLNGGYAPRSASAFAPRSRTMAPQTVSPMGSVNIARPGLGFPTAPLPVMPGLQMPMLEVNDEGAVVSKGTVEGNWYCGRQLGVTVIAGSDGRCGPDDGPQCASCKRFQQANAAAPAAPIFGGSMPLQMPTMAPRPMTTYGGLPPSPMGSLAMNMPARPNGMNSPMGSLAITMPARPNFFGGGQAMVQYDQGKVVADQQNAVKQQKFQNVLKKAEIDLARKGNAVQRAQMACQQIPAEVLKERTLDCDRQDLVFALQDAQAAAEAAGIAVQEKQIALRQFDLPPPPKPAIKDKPDDAKAAKDGGKDAKGDKDGGKDAKPAADAKPAKKKD